jgi:hypothetical protein
LPRTGDINEQFGVYTSRCCSAEIVIGVGREFPECPNHPKQNADWMLIDEESKDKERRSA